MSKVEQTTRALLDAIQAAAERIPFDPDLALDSVFELARHVCADIERDASLLARGNAAKAAAIAGRARACIAAIDARPVDENRHPPPS